ncbi:hypothetical protein CapIbe_018745 [Capra ibex]
MGLVASSTAAPGVPYSKELKWISKSVEGRRDRRSVTHSERAMRGDSKKRAICKLRRVLTKNQPASTSS